MTDSFQNRPSIASLAILPPICPFCNLLAARPPCKHISPSSPTLSLTHHASHATKACTFARLLLQAKKNEPTNLVPRDFKSGGGNASAVCSRVSGPTVYTLPTFTHLPMNITQAQTGPQPRRSTHAFRIGYSNSRQRSPYPSDTTMPTACGIYYRETAPSVFTVFYSFTLEIDLSASALTRILSDRFMDVASRQRVTDMVWQKAESSSRQIETISLSNISPFSLALDEGFRDGRVCGGSRSAHIGELWHFHRTSPVDRPKINCQTLRLSAALL